MELNQHAIRKLILGAMGCIVLYWLLHETERLTHVLNLGFNLFKPFLVGSCVAFVLNVPMRAFETQLRRSGYERGTRGFSILLTFAVIVLLLVFLVGMLVPQIEDTVKIIASQISPFVNRCMDKAQELLRQNPELNQWIVENTNLDEWLAKDIDLTGIINQTLDLVGKSLSTIFGGAVSVVGNAVSSAWSVVVSLVFSVYCLANKDRLVRQFRKLSYAFLPERAADEVIRILRLTNSTFSNFIAGQCIEVCILGSMFALSMSIFRMPYVALVSVLVAATAFIPIVGAWIGCVLGAFFILVDNPMQAVWFVVLFLVLQQIENNLIYPRVVGTSIGLPSMWVLAAVSVGGSIMGVAGMVLMIPMVSVLYALLREFSNSRIRSRGIDPQKLEPQPPEIRSKFKERREHRKRLLEAKKAAELAEMMKRSLHIPDHKDKEQKQ